jgi:hypothetical protein
VIVPEKDGKPWDARLMEWLSRDAAVARTTRKRQTRGEWAIACVFGVGYIAALLTGGSWRWWVLLAIVGASYVARYGLRFVQRNRARN